MDFEFRLTILISIVYLSRIACNLFNVYFFGFKTSFCNSNLLLVLICLVTLLFFLLFTVHFFYSVNWLVIRFYDSFTSLLLRDLNSSLIFTFPFVTFNALKFLIVIIQMLTFLLLSGHLKIFAFVWSFKFLPISYLLKFVFFTCN